MTTALIDHQGGYVERRIVDSYRVLRFFNDLSNVIHGGTMGICTNVNGLLSVHTNHLTHVLSLLRILHRTTRLIVTTTNDEGHVARYGGNPTKAFNVGTNEGGRFIYFCRANDVGQYFNDILFSLIRGNGNFHFTTRRVNRYNLMLLRLYVMLRANQCSLLSNYGSFPQGYTRRVYHGTSLYCYQLRPIGRATSNVYIYGTIRTSFYIVYFEHGLSGTIFYVTRTTFWNFRLHVHLVSHDPMD